MTSNWSQTDLTMTSGWLHTDLWLTSNWPLTDMSRGEVNHTHTAKNIYVLLLLVLSLNWLHFESCFKTRLQSLFSWYLFFLKVNSDEELLETSGASEGDSQRFNHVNWGRIRTALHFLILLTLKIHKVEQEKISVYLLACNVMTDWGTFNDIHRGLEDYNLTYSYEFIIILMLQVLLVLAELHQRWFVFNYVLKIIIFRIILSWNLSFS